MRRAPIRRWEAKPRNKSMHLVNELLNTYKDDHVALCAGWGASDNPKQKLSTND